MRPFTPIRLKTGAVFLLLICFILTANAAKIVQDNFTGASTSINWKSFNGACLTAGNGKGSIPACKSLKYYKGQKQYGLKQNKDSVGHGALRFTNGRPYYFQNGGIISRTTFPTNEGIKVTFTTYTYGGDSWGRAHDGADGMGFYLLNGDQTPNLGAFGGSLGYSCDNGPRWSNYDGMVGGYIGLGIDEYGNYLNPIDNTVTGIGFQPEEIGLRGHGNVAWRWLHHKYPKYYPSKLSSRNRALAVEKTCKTGHIYNYSNPRHPHRKSTKIADYAAIPGAYAVLPTGRLIANEKAKNRTQATPITYKLQISQDGLLSFWYSFNGGTYMPVLTKQSIKASNGPLPNSFKFGFGGSTGGSDNVHEVTCFHASPAKVSASSAGVNTEQSGEVKTGTQVYLAYFHPNNWWSDLDSQNLVMDPSTGAVSISSTANWDASCVLTGGLCPTTGKTNQPAQSPAQRTLLTWNGSDGVPLAWSSLSASERRWLNAGDNRGKSRLGYIQGNRGDEITTTGKGLFRARTSLLGDIMDSSPTWVGPAAAPYPETWKDWLYPAASPPENGGTQTYKQFKAAEATRLNVVYAGSNDGFLHGFRSGSYDSAGNYVANSTTPNDGKEVLAYMPQAVLQTIHNASNPTQDYFSTHYAHKFFVDATPGVGDLFYGGAWHTWLVGGLGAGGKAIFALDVTKPAAFSSGDASDIVKGEWNPSTLICVGDTNSKKCGDNLGQTYGTPQIRRLHNGKWAVIFGNGFNSASGHAGIYVMTVDPYTGSSRNVYFLDTGVGSASKPDGIAYVTPANLDEDHIIDYVYAGDIYGNVWRFDLTSSNPDHWHVSTFGQNGPTPLFTTPSGQPITTAVVATAVPTPTGGQRVIVTFGTGAKTPQTTSSPARYATGQQSLYGIWDWNMGQAGATSGWNAQSSVHYASLTSTSRAPSRITTAQLQEQTVTDHGASGSEETYRTLSDHTVCYVGSTCTEMRSGHKSMTVSGTRFGWFINLPDYAGVNRVGGNNQTEQVIYSPVEAYGALILNTTIPANNSPFTCSSRNNHGWTLAINQADGGGFAQSFFANSAGKFTGIHQNVISGLALNATGNPSVVTAQGNPWLVDQTVDGVGTVNQINPPGEGKGGRLTWIELH